ncbi:MAG: GNAT family N-acetyltransferase [Chitinophagales bacterium]|nr:GNAT family N-acetyltransferase [Sphingobacteriales bacterium]
MRFTKIIFDSVEYWQLLRMRELVLRLPLGMRYSAQDIEKEKDEWIYACEVDGKIVASCQFILENKKAKMRQVATAMNFQGKGFGKELYLHCEEELKKQGVNEIYCHARKSALVFYQKLGFKIVSEEFEEVGIPHYKMKKNLA